MMLTVSECGGKRPASRPVTEAGRWHTIAEQAEWRRGNDSSDPLQDGLIEVYLAYAEVSEPHLQSSFVSTFEHVLKSCQDGTE